MTRSTQSNAPPSPHLEGQEPIAQRLYRRWLSQEWDESAILSHPRPSTPSGVLYTVSRNNANIPAPWVQTGLTDAKTRNREAERLARSHTAMEKQSPTAIQAAQRSIPCFRHNPLRTRPRAPEARAGGSLQQVLQTEEMSCLTPAHSDTLPQIGSFLLSPSLFRF